MGIQEAASRHPPNRSRRPLDLSSAVRGATLGHSAEVGKLVASHLGVRVTAYQFDAARTQDYDEVRYDPCQGAERVGAR